MSEDTMVHLACRSLGYPRASLALALLLLLAAAGPVAAQDFKPRPGDDPATEEPSFGDDELEDLGITGDRSYESPQFGYTLEWGRDWTLDAISGDPVISDEDAGFDTLNLFWQGTRTQTAYLSIEGVGWATGGPDVQVAQWTDEDFLEDIWDPGDYTVEVLLEDEVRDAGAVAIRVVDEELDFSFLAYQQIMDVDDTWVFVYYAVLDIGVEDGYAALAEEIELNGAPIELLFDVEEIVEAFEAP
jgi:hypothetical protein